MSELSNRTVALNQKRLNDATQYGKFMSKLGWFAVVVAILEGIFDYRHLFGMYARLLLVWGSGDSLLS